MELETTSKTCYMEQKLVTCTYIYQRSCRVAMLQTLPLPIYYEFSPLFISLAVFLHPILSLGTVWEEEHSSMLHRK